MCGQVPAAKVQHGGYQINKPPTTAIFDVNELANNDKIVTTMNDNIVMAVSSISMVVKVMVNVIV